MKPPFQVIAEIRKVETLARGMRVKLDTNEVSPEEAARLLEYRDQQGWFLFAPQEIKSQQIEDLPEIELEVGEKHPSVRLRAAIYRLWEQGKKDQDFELYYRRYMERFIDSVKEKLV